MFKANPLSFLLSVCQHYLLLQETFKGRIRSRNPMAKVFVEICLISARGLPRSSSFLKQQWFAVGWIDPNNKYCSKIDSSGSSNPTWKTKFSVYLDDANLDPQRLTLTVEVHSRDSVFLREKLHGSVVIPLKEFLAKFSDDPNGWMSGFEEVGSFQLRGKNSGKPRGFVDVSVRISEKRMQDSTLSGGYGSSQFPEMGEAHSGISLAIEGNEEIAHQAETPSLPANGRTGNQSLAAISHDLPYQSRPLKHRYGGRNGRSSSSQTSHPANNPYIYQTPQQHPPSDYENYSRYATDNQRPSTPPPPPPPSNTGFIPTFFPPQGSYTNLPPTKRNEGSGGGVGAGLAAGAVIFGDDFMSNAHFPTSFGGGNFDTSSDRPF